MRVNEEDVLQKHVSVGMKNKEVMSGFVVEVGPEILKFVDYDNSIVYVNPDCVAYIKIATSGSSAIRKIKSDLEKNEQVATNDQETSRPDLAAIVKRPRQQEFSMTTPKPSSWTDSSPCGSIPTFERQTKRGENDS
jgi:hypothetical protein